MMKQMQGSAGPGGVSLSYLHLSCSNLLLNFDHCAGTRYGSDGKHDEENGSKEEIRKLLQFFEDLVSSLLSA